MKKIFYVIIVLSLCSCATGYKFERVVLPKSGDSVIYLFRNFVPLDGSAPGLSINGVSAGSLPQGQYYRYEGKPGTNKIVIKKSVFWDHDPIELELMSKPNDVKYVIFYYDENVGEGLAKALFGHLPSRSAQRSKFSLFEIEDKEIAQKILLKSKGKDVGFSDGK